MFHHQVRYIMRSSVSKNIRKAARAVSVSKNDGTTREMKRKILLNSEPILQTKSDGTQEYINPIVWAVTNVRTLNQNSEKYLAKRLKRVFRKLSSKDRAKFFPVLARDVASILAKHTA